MTFAHTNCHCDQPLLRSAVRRLVWLLLCAISFETELFSQQLNPAPVADPGDLSLEQLVNIQVESVFGASKYEQKVTEAPASISIVTSDEIKKFGYRTLA